MIGCRPLSRLLFLLVFHLLPACGDPKPEDSACAKGEIRDGNTCVPEACGTGTWGNLGIDDSTVYVDAGANEGGDGSKKNPFASIQAGLDAQAKDRMVAVAAGTYVENLKLNVHHAGMHLAGRCPELVILDASEPQSSLEMDRKGIYVLGDEGVEWTVSGLTISHSRDVGIYQGRGRLILRNMTISNNFYEGIFIGAGALDATDIVVTRNRSNGIYIRRAEVRLERCVIEDTAPTDGTGEMYNPRGFGINITDNSSLMMLDSTLQGNAIGLFASAGSEVVLEGGRISDSPVALDWTIGAGIFASRNSSVTPNGLIIEGVLGPGLWVAMGGHIACTDCTLIGNAFAGAAVQMGGHLELRESIIEGTVSAGIGGGVGIFADDYWDPTSPQIEDDALNVLVLQDSILRNNEMSAVYLRGHGSFHLLDNEISGSEGRSLSPGWWEYGDAVSASTGFNSTIGPWDEAVQTGLLLENNILSDSSGAGLFLNGASATLVGNTWSGNSTDIWQQACSGVSTPEGLEEEDLATTEFCPTWDRMTLDLILQEKLIEPDIEE